MNSNFYMWSPYQFDLSQLIFIPWSATGPTVCQTNEPIQRSIESTKEKKIEIFERKLIRMLREKHGKPQNKIWSLEEDDKLLDLVNSGEKIEEICQIF